MSPASQFSIEYRPLHSQITIFREEEEGEVSGSFTLEGEQFGTVHFMDSQMAFFRIPARPLIRYMGHILHKYSFTPFSNQVNKLKPFKHCALVRQALNSPGVKECKLLVQQDRDVTLFRSSQDFHTGSIARRSTD